MRRIRGHKRPLAVAAMVVGMSLASLSGASAYEASGTGSARTECTAPQQLQVRDHELCRAPLGSLESEYLGRTEQSQPSSSVPFRGEWFVVGGITGLLVAAAATIFFGRRHALG